MAIVRWKMADLMPPEVYAIVARRRELDEGSGKWPDDDDGWWEYVHDITTVVTEDANGFIKLLTPDDEGLVELGAAIIAWLRWRSTMREVADADTSQ